MDRLEIELSQSASLTTLPLTLSEGGDVVVQRMWLRVLSGPDAGKAAGAKGDRIVIGTHESADLELTDTAVSRFHCEIRPERGFIVLRDLGSKNGTFVNGVSVIEARLVNGSVLTVGQNQIRFELGEDTVTVALSKATTFGTMVGHSQAMRRVFAVLERAAQSDATVLIMGETGTGKEAVAESVHLESGRSEGPFVILDCSAIPAELLESELFGHEKGSFTGAHSTRDGAFQAAHGGTIFLDELGELPIALQPKLLRVLEKRQVKRVGSNKYTPIDVRVIAATNRDLKEEVNARRFRSDLYYRLAVLEVQLPPLRERPEDLPGLVDHILTEGFAEEQARFLRTPGFLTSLTRHRWPGNVRELRNYLERCVALREQAALGDADVGAARDDGGAAPDVDTSMPFKEARDEWVRAFEHRYLEALLAECEGNVSAAARKAGLDRVYFYRLLWRHGLK